MQRFEFIETRRFGEKRNNLKYKIPLWPDVKGPVRIELAYFGISISPPTHQRRWLKTSVKFLMLNHMTKKIFGVPKFFSLSRDKI